MSIKGVNAAQEYLVNGIQEVYRLQGVRINGESRWNAVWTEAEGPFASFHNMTLDSFADRWTQFGDLGWQLVDFNVFDGAGSVDSTVFGGGSGMRINATWVDRPHSGYIAHYDMDAETYDALFDEAGIGTALRRQAERVSDIYRH